MKRIIAVTAVAISLAAGSFAGGTWWAHGSGAAHASAHAAAVYTCPMHPDYRSGHPGNCPICGMPLEAVRAGAATGGGAAARALPPGAVQVSPARQQAIGIRLGVVTPVGRHAAAADDRARGARREPDVSDRRRRERLDPERGERDDGRRREKGPGARVVRSRRRSSSGARSSRITPASRPSIASRSHSRSNRSRSRTSPRAERRRSTGWPTSCGPLASPTRSSGRWAGAASSYVTSVWSRRSTASCCSAMSRPACGSNAGSSSTGSRI